MRVTDVKYLKEYKLKVTFSNKITRIIDFEEKLKKAKGIFLPLKDMEYFKLVSVDDCCASICWPNGADVCPDVLYEMGRTVGRGKPQRSVPVKKPKSSQKSGLKTTK